MPMHLLHIYEKLLETLEEKHLKEPIGRLITITSAGQTLKHCDERLVVPNLHLESLSVPDTPSLLGACRSVRRGPCFLLQSSFCSGCHTPRNVLPRGGGSRHPGL